MWALSEVRQAIVMVENRIGRDSFMGETQLRNGRCGVFWQPPPVCLCLDGTGVEEREGGERSAGVTACEMSPNRRRHSYKLCWSSSPSSPACPTSPFIAASSLFHHALQDVGGAVVSAITRVLEPRRVSSGSPAVLLQGSCQRRRWDERRRFYDQSQPWFWRHFITAFLPQLSPA